MKAFDRIEGRGWAAAITAGTLLIVALQLLPYAVGNPWELMRRGLLIDDAFFYSTVAANLPVHGFPTFDGQTSTNGFQPLWLLVQAGLAAVWPASDPARLLVVSSWACYVAFSGLAIAYLVRRSSLPGFAAAGFFACATLLQPFFQRLVVKGLEVPLMLLLLVSLLFAFERVRETMREPRSARARAAVLGLGLLAALLFLARTDMFWAAAVLLAWLLRAEKRVTWNTVLFCGAVTALVLPYLAFNHFSQGGLMPISGRVKLFYMESFSPGLGAYLRSDEWRGILSAVDQAFGLRSLPLPLGVRYAVAGAAVIAAAAFAWRVRKARDIPEGFKLLGVISVLHALYMHLVHREVRPYTAYYFAPEIVWMALAGALALRGGLERAIAASEASRPASKRGPLLALLASGVFLAVSWAGRETGPVPFWTARADLAGDVSREVPPGETVAAFWPGVFAQYGGHRTFPLDGIIGSNAYFRDYVRRGREFDYLRENRIRFLVIFLERNNFEKIMGRAAGEPIVANWADLGTRRLYENRASIRGLVRSRRVDDRRGWYLFELDATPTVAPASE